MFNDYKWFYEGSSSIYIYYYVALLMIFNLIYMIFIYFFFINICTLWNFNSLFIIICSFIIFIYYYYYCFRPIKTVNNFVFMYNWYGINIQFFFRMRFGLDYDNDINASLLNFQFLSCTWPNIYKSWWAFLENLDYKIMPMRCI